jgi:hypothetical protein
VILRSHAVTLKHRLVILLGQDPMQVNGPCGRGAQAVGPVSHLLHRVPEEVVYAVVGALLAR